MKEQYIQAIQSILSQHASYLGDQDCLYAMADSILSSGFQWVREFSKNPQEETVVHMVLELSQANTQVEKVTHIMTLAFVLGTTKMPTDVATALFDEVLSRLFDSQVSDEELTTMKAMIVGLYTTATENSPY